MRETSQATKGRQRCLQVSRIAIATLLYTITTRAETLGLVRPPRHGHRFGSFPIASHEASREPPRIVRSRRMRIIPPRLFLFPPQSDVRHLAKDAGVARIRLPSSRWLPQEHPHTRWTSCMATTPQKRHCPPHRGLVRLLRATRSRQMKTRRTSCHVISYGHNGTVRESDARRAIRTNR